MAGILDRYGLKDVCDVTFYALENGKPSYPVLYSESVKTFTIEQSADTNDARGGQGNPILLSWDSNKEITVTLEDALFSAKSLAIMFSGSEKPSTYSSYIMRTYEWVATDTATLPSTLDIKGTTYSLVNVKAYDEEGATVASTSIVKGTKYLISADFAQKADTEAKVIEISPNTFPGTYYVVGDTFVRNMDGKDEFFQVIIPKAKVTSENTITMEADGDPSVFSMNLRAMKAEDGKLVKFVKYELSGTDATDSATIYHNHVLNPNNENANG